MIAKVKLDLYLEVENGEMAEAACGELGRLSTVLEGMSFPYGEPLLSDVQVWQRASQEEIKEHGLEEM